MIKRSHILIALLSLVIVGVSVFTITIQTRAAVENAQLVENNNEIKSVVTEAFASTVTLLVIPETTTGMSTNSLALAPATTAVNLSDTVAMTASPQAISVAHSRVQNRFNAFFMTSSLIGKKLYAELQDTVQGQSQGRYRALGGGIRDIHWRTILINGDQASVTVDATLVSRVKYSDEKGETHIVTPTTGYVKIFSLQQINGHWLVSDVVNDDLQADQLLVNHTTANDR